MKYIVGNWKMNQSLEQAVDFFTVLKSEKFISDCTAWVAPQFVHLQKLNEIAKGTQLKVGAQNCGPKDKGAFTGEVSPLQLKEVGAHFTLIGHSERRHIFGEDHELLNQKAKEAQNADLFVIFCVGETLQERESGKTLAVIEEQLDFGLKDIMGKKLIVAYEPVWAIGTGKTATPEQAQDVHSHIRARLSQKYKNSIPLLYGGSMKPSNALDLLTQPDIDGGLVGGASLKTSDFRSLCEIASKAMH